MNNGSKIGIGVVTGLLAGFAGGWFISKTSYEKKLLERYFEEDSKPSIDLKVKKEEKINEELDNMFEAKNINTDPRLAYAPVDEEKPETYNEKISDEKIDKTIPVSNEKKPKTKYRDLTEEEYIHLDDYDKSVITLYSDGFMYDDYDQQVHPQDTIGRERFTRFLSGDRTTIHVRNNYIRTDFELLYDPRPSTEVVRHISSENFEPFEFEDMPLGDD